MLRNLTNDRARRLLMDAIEDPELFRTLLMQPEAWARSEAARSRLAPYLAAGVANAVSQEEDEPLRLIADDPGNQRRRAAQ